MMQIGAAEFDSSARRLNVTRLVSGATCAILVAGLLVSLAYSLQWRIVHDSPLMFYAALLFDRFGRVPYRDLFDMNMPGTYAIHLLVIRLFGTSDFAIRLADVTYLAGIFTLTWLWMRPFGHRVALTAPTLFGLIYLSRGPTMSFQREYLLLLPLIAGLLLCGAFRPPAPGVRTVLMGVCFGLMATIKPQAAAALVVVLGTIVIQHRAEVSRRTLVQFVAFSLLGAFVPVLATALTLLSIGSLNDFLAISVGYWPLYGALTGSHQVIPSYERPRYLIVSLFVMLLRQLPLILAARTGLLATRSTPLARSAQLPTMIGLAAFFGVYPLLSGQYWDYHILPFQYALSLIAALCVVDAPSGHSVIRRVLPTAILVLALLATAGPSPELRAQLRGNPLPAPKDGRPDAIATYLRAHLRPGESVQPLDWTGGAVHALYLAQAPLATRFMYDFHFYHHISRPFIQSLRREFVAALEQSPPRFIVEILPTAKPTVSGPDTTRDFPALRKLISTLYFPVASGDGWIIYERRNVTPRLVVGRQ